LIPHCVVHDRSLLVLVCRVIFFFFFACFWTRNDAKLAFARGRNSGWSREARRRTAVTHNSGLCQRWWWWRRL
jgi:hypothetical protein